MSGVQTVLHIISLLTGIIHDSIPVFLYSLFFIFLIKQVDPGFNPARKFFFTLISYHSAEHIGPCTGYDLCLLVKLHAPETRVHGRMNVIH